MTGAPDDCFTCAKRGAQCDRRRPFCSQCIDRGQECAGYKTTLTWGVGVASRGKLRGLSLPVKGSRPAVNPPNPRLLADSGRLAGARLPTKGTEHSQVAVPAESRAPLADHQPPPSGNAPSMHAPPSSNIPAPFSHETNQLGNSNIYTPGVPQTLGYNSLYPPGVAHTLANPPSEGNAPPNSAQNWSEMSQSSTPAAQRLSYSELESQEETPADQTDDTEPPVDADARNSHWTAGDSPSFSELLLVRSVGRTPRLRYLITYYVEVIAPVIVAFDGPTNPFRTQVMRLAEESESLQEAIATLSTSNLKQRRQAKTMATERTLQSRMSSIAQRALTKNNPEGDISMPDGLAREEQFHRGMAVRALNSELGDPRRRLSDSVLATLLVLCLFHVCDTGVAQFRTHFAGVKKLLAIRMRNAGSVSDGLKWFIRFFTLVDTMTATTNNREAELSGTCLDIATSSNEEWGLENFAGLDSDLFRLVAQLGRLNLLSQNQAVRAPTPPGLYPATATLPASMLHSPLDLAYGANLPVSGPVNIYGFPIPAPGTSDQGQPLSPGFWSEWFSLRQRLESWRISPQTAEVILPSHPTGQSTSHPYISPPSSPNSQHLVPSQNLPDIFNISESFRHSAILYIERLAYPDLPSSHPRLQSIVHVALQHISAVQSDVFLLWPLFITGSECILEEQRTMIRNRCRNISKDSGFFNNISCIDLLEKIWAQDQDAGGGSAGQCSVPGSYGMFHDQALGNAMADFSGNEVPGDQHRPRVRGFRWDRVIQSMRADGEYMVV